MECAPHTEAQANRVPQLSQDLLLLSACFSQPCAKHSITQPASAPSPAAWVPDAPETSHKVGKKNLTPADQQRKHN